MDEHLHTIVSCLMELLIPNLALTVIFLNPLRAGTELTRFN